MNTFTVAFKGQVEAQQTTVISRLSASVSINDANGTRWTVAGRFLHSAAPFSGQGRSRVCIQGRTQEEGTSMVKMSVDPVQVMSGQVKELQVAASSNGDSRGSWEEKEEFNRDGLGVSTKPKQVSLVFSPRILKLHLCPDLPCCCLILMSQMFMLPTCSSKPSSEPGVGVRQGEANVSEATELVDGLPAHCQGYFDTEAHSARGSGVRRNFWEVQLKSSKG